MIYCPDDNEHTIYARDAQEADVQDFDPTRTIFDKDENEKRFERHYRAKNKEMRGMWERVSCD